MNWLLETLRAGDGAASSFGEDIRWGPATFVFLLVLDVVGQVAVDRGDRLGRRLLAAADRTAAGAALAAVGLAALLVTVLKATFDRARPPLANPALDVVGSLPASASFPRATRQLPLRARSPSG